jgi:hypothetical protein
MFSISGSQHNQPRSRKEEIKRRCGNHPVLGELEVVSSTNLFVRSVRYCKTEFCKVKSGRIYSHCCGLLCIRIRRTIGGRSKWLLGSPNTRSRASQITYSIAVTPLRCTVDHERALIRRDVQPIPRNLSCTPDLMVLSTRHLAIKALSCEMQGLRS